jgi:Leucine rich repeat N-terminal domain
MRDRQRKYFLQCAFSPFVSSFYILSRPSSLSSLFFLSQVSYFPAISLALFLRFCCFFSLLLSSVLSLLTKQREYWCFSRSKINMRTLALLTLLCLAVTACEALSAGEIQALTDMKSEWAVSGWDAAPSAACGNWPGITCVDDHVTQVYVFLFKDISRSHFLYLSTEECVCVCVWNDRCPHASVFLPSRTDISTFILKHAVNIVTNRALYNNGLTGSIPSSLGSLTSLQYL